MNARTIPDFATKMLIALITFLVTNAYAEKGFWAMEKVVSVKVSDFIGISIFQQRKFI